ncbi:MAG: AI-2E family transporter [Bdellovibrionales bacterium]|nr:AI-2E family transporter [Bdellovibrionales bacterium]
MHISEHRRKQLKLIEWIRLGSFIGFLGFFILILVGIDNLLLSFVLALVINYLLGPIVNSLERAGVHRLFSTVLVFSLGGIFVGFGITAIVPFLSSQFSNLQEQFPTYIGGVSRLITQLELKIQDLTGVSYQTDFGLEAESVLLGWTKSLFTDLPGIVSQLGTTLLLSPFFAFFLIKDGRLFAKNFLSIVPNHIFELTLNMYYQINDQMGQFVRARLLEALIVALAVWVGLYAINFPFAGLLSLFAGVTNLIPYVGPLFGAIPAIIIALINDSSTFTLVMLCVVYGTAQLIDIFFIIPLVVAKLVNLHPITVVVAMIVGAQLLGILGMIISIPVASVLKVTITSVYQHLVEFRA